MDYKKMLRPGKREGAFFVEYETCREKIGMDSPNNGMFYGYVWDPEQNKTVDVLFRSSDLQFH